MEKTIYFVKSETRNNQIIEEFDTFDEALSCAISELRKKPYIEAHYIDDEYEGLDMLQDIERVWSWEDYLDDSVEQLDFEEELKVEEVIDTEDDLLFSDYLNEEVESEEYFDFFDVDDVAPCLDVEAKLVEGYTMAQLDKLTNLCAQYGIVTMKDLDRITKEYGIADPLQAVEKHAEEVGQIFLPYNDQDAMDNFFKHRQNKAKWDKTRRKSEEYDIDKMVEDLEKIESENLDEHVLDRKEEPIESEQELSGTDNAVVDCEVAEVVAHSEDEKPVDCKMEKAPLEEPLTEDSSASAEPVEMDGVEVEEDSTTTPQESIDIEEVKDDLEEVKDKLDDAESYEEFINMLKDIMKNPAQHKALAAVFDQLRAEDTEVEVDPNATVPVKDLIPTQSEIDVDGVLSELNTDSIEDVCAEPACQRNMPVVLDGKYILDGHHRWCRAYALNKDGNIAVINCDFGADIDPLEALKKIQTAIAATESGEELPSEAAEVKANIYEMEDDDIKDLAGRCVSDECAEKIKEVNPDLKDQEAICDYITKNCIDLKNCNQPIEGAQPRWLMPQITEEAVEAVEKGILTEEVDENGFSEFDEPTECEWCGEVFGKDQLRKEVDLGYLCGRCEAAIKSRGEKLTFEENSYFDYLYN